MKDKTAAVAQIHQELSDKGFKIAEENIDKPWGAYFRIEEDQTEAFIKEYFSKVDLPPFDPSLKLSPKILLVEPKKRLSWQYHHRRREIWTVLSGPVEIVLNDKDKLVSGKMYQAGEFVSIGLGQRHRLVGLNDWGIVAEIWVHTDPSNPSNEDDIVRLEDDFNR